MAAPPPWCTGRPTARRNIIARGSSNAPTLFQGPGSATSIRQITELIGVQVGNQPEAHAILREVTEIESIAHRFRGRGLASRRPNEYVDQVLSAPVHEHRNALAVNHIDTPSKKVEPAS